MSPEKQRIAIAKACGWTEWNVVSPIDRTTPLMLWVRGDLNAETRVELPDYLNDLNAMRDAPHNLSLLQYNDYGTCLYNVVARDNSKNVTSYGVFDATAAQRAEAFLRTLNLWEEE